MAKVDKAEKIVVSGEEFVQTSSSSNELQMSFMNVATNGYDEARFNAELQFESLAVGEDVLRFDDIATALTHVLYRYELDEDGNPVYETNENGDLIIKRTRISDNFLNITYQDGKVNVKAFKNLGGGLFRLVLASKDSYNLALDPATIVLEEENFDTTYAVTIRVEDGTKAAAYSIKSADELLMINFNLDKHFRLAANIDLSRVEDLKPLGLINTDVHEFTGSLNGEMTSLIGEEKIKTTSYSITMKVGGYVDTDTYGKLSGLFAIIGEDASISNVQLNVRYVNSFVNTNEKGVKVGSLAGVNNGTIKNVEVYISSNVGDEVDFTGVTAGSINFGGIVGLNNSQIIHSRVENINTLTIVSGAEREHYVGLMAGTNAKDASIVGAYVGKESLNNFMFDVIADVNVINRAASINTVYYVGGVSGLNNGLISGILIGGNMGFEAVVDGIQTGAMAGVVGHSLGDGNSVQLSTALALDINSMAQGIDVAGIIGHALNTQVNTVKFVSVEVDNNSIVSTGKIMGINLVSGVIAKSEAAIVEYASVESFIEYNYDEARLNKNTYYTIIGGEKTAGIIATAIATELRSSFVRANILSLGDINLTSDLADEVNTHYIGKVERDENEELIDNTTYSLVNGVLTSKVDPTLVLNLELYMPGTTVSNETTNW